MSKKSKKRKRGFRPPLSFVDKSIYWLGLLLVFPLTVLLAFWFDDVTGVIAFQDPAVIAYRSHPSYFFIIPLVLYAEISVFLLCLMALEGKKPLLGNKKVQYGEAPWAKDCFPLFDPRRKSVSVRPSEKRFRRRMRIVWVIGFFLCSLLAPFSFCGRDCLMQDNSIVTYDALNQKAPNPYIADEFTALTIRAQYASKAWMYEITIQTEDGMTFTFSYEDFDWRKPGRQETCLRKMLEIKALFPPDAITIKGEQKLEKVVDYLGLNEELTQLLYQLFQ